MTNELAMQHLMEMNQRLGKLEGRAGKISQEIDRLIADISALRDERVSELTSHFNNGPTVVQ